MKKSVKFLCIILSLLLTLSLSSCGEDSTEETVSQDAVAAEESEDEYYDDEIDTSNTNTDYFDEEIEGAAINKVEKSEKDFYGTWIATSEVAEYFYGNVTITIKEGGVWNGIITDEKLSGTWKKGDSGLSLTSELFDCTLSFTDNGTLIMQEFNGDDESNPSEDDYITTVLIKK